MTPTPTIVVLHVCIIITDRLPQGKLDGAKRLLPFALFLSVPALCREWYVITEETMLMGCFFLFLGAAMDFGGAGIGKFFDDKV